MSPSFHLRRLLWTCRAVIWTASWLVPRARRSEWARRRNTQAWHWCHFLVESGRRSRATELELVRHCWSAFADALWQRFERDAFLARLDHMWRRPAFCLASLAIVLLSLILITGFAPAARSMFSAPYVESANLFTLRPAGRFAWFRSDSLLGLTSAWRRSRPVQAIAAYSWGPATLDAGGRTLPVLAARVSPGFFDVLGVRAAHGRTFAEADLESCRDCVLLSAEAWNDVFDRDSRLIGRSVEIQGAAYRVVGILPDRFSFLLSDIAAWSLLGPADKPFSNFVDRMGAVARLTPGMTGEAARAELQDAAENAGYYFRKTPLEIASVRSEARLATRWYLLFLAMALLGSVAIVRSGRARANSSQPASGLRQIARWWAFFLSKSALLLAGTFVIALESARYLSRLFTGTTHSLAGILSLWLFMLGAIAVLSWAIHDQRRRCRVCLQRLGMSVHVGCPGYFLLDWAATEMLCANGHGMLHMPDVECSWFDHDRWNHLDKSWADLFQGREPSS
jgi:hypothetical protein